MAAGGHFLFTLFKIALLASVYSLLLWAFFKRIGKSKPESWFHRTTINKRSFLIEAGVSISIVLLAWLFSYWGDHGWGDHFRIPIGNGLAVEGIDLAEYGYIKNLQTSKDKDIEMTMFKVHNNVLVGNLDSHFYSYRNQYFIYDMSKKVMLEFSNQAELDNYTSRNDLPDSSELLTFNTNYHQHWNGWRFLLLP
ncbi:MAG: hypothetical protein ACRBF0_09030 [Calditrichia bacterium]